MMALSQTTGYAIRALSCLGTSETGARFMQELAEASEVPQAYLAKILKKLNNAGIVEAKRGYKGGVWLARVPEKITMLEITEALDGKDCLSCCLLGEEFCSDLQACHTHGFWKKTRALIREELKRKTLAEVMQFNQRRGVYQIEKKAP